MASLLPLIQDLLPMILPSQIHITRARDLAPNPAPATGSSPEPRLDLPSITAPSDAAVVPSPPGHGVDEDKQLVREGDPGSAAPPAPPLAGVTAAASTDAGLPKVVAGRGVLRRDAIINKTDRMCASVLFAGPRSSSAVHHNSEHDSIIYAASGRGILATGPPEDDGPPKRDELEPGDFVFVPAWTEHQLINDTDEQVTWVVIQGGPSPIVVDLEEWGGDEAKPERS